MLAEYDENSSLITLYTRGEELISQERNGEKSYYLYDGFDSVRMLTDEDNNITDTYTFDAFGNLVSSTGDTENSYLYRGEQYDSFTGLYYLRARYMNPTTGTFISMDEYAGSVFEPVSLHKYLYANANPVTYCDPTGYSAMAADQCVAMAGLAILCTMVVANYDGIINAISFMLTEIYDAFAIATDTIAEWCAGLASGMVTSADMCNDVQQSTTSDGDNDSSGGSANPGNPKKPKKPKNYRHFELDEILRRFGLTKEQWHRIIKPGILSWLSQNIGSFSEEAQKAYRQLGRNPDFYFSLDGYIKLVGVQSKKSIELLVDIYWFIENLLPH